MSSIENNNGSNQKQRGDGGVVGSLGGKKYWKSMDELADTAAYREFVEKEFPENASELLDPVSRRSFLGLMAGSMALAGLTGCKVLRRPEEKIMTYNNQPEHMIPGKPLYFATSMALGEEVSGLVVESHQGRPTKIEGNKWHPASLGACNKFQQASILGLYDPDRSKHVLKKGKKVDGGLASFWKEVQPTIDKYREKQGAKLTFLSEYIVSPSTAKLKRQVQKELPQTKWVTHEPASRINATEGLQKISGQWLNPHYSFDKAKTIVSLDCDFLSGEINSLANSKAFMSMRNPDKPRSEVNRLYVIESNYSVTGAKADHRLRLKPSSVKKVIWSIAHSLFVYNGLPLPVQTPENFKNKFVKQGFGKVSPAISNIKWIKEACLELLKNKGKGILCVGQYQDPEIHALAHLINLSLGNVGETVNYKKSSTHTFNEDFRSGSKSLFELETEILKGNVETLVILGGNPAFTAPVDFKNLISKVSQVIHVGTENDETCKISTWHVPRKHFLEEWSDALAYDGTASIVQPLIVPLYIETISISEFLAGWLGNSISKDFDIVKNYWKTKVPSLNGSKWKKWLHDGLIKNSGESNFAAGVIVKDLLKLSKNHINGLTENGSKKLEILLRPHATIHDGRFANNGWLQELPDPMTRLTWDNAALMSVATAKSRGLDKQIILEDQTGNPLGDLNRPLIELTVGNKKIKIPAFILPGLSDDTVLIHYGYGRSTVGRVGTDTGFNAYALKSNEVLNEGYNVHIVNTGNTHPLASVQEHWSMEGRDLVRVEDQEAHKHHKDHHEFGVHGAYGSLFKEHTYSEGQQWGMVIDLNRCTGCGDCVTACQAENNIPVVGKDRVLDNREMHWIRMDRYFTGSMDEPEVVHQAVACQHCEMAPCEEVCPVAATTHSSEGLNDMAYNRCIGTRYCSNNCPYKVRRFNFFNYTNEYKETEKMAQNPDVTVRFRGVMEKCTYCVQRINEARIEYKNKGIETIPEGGITPACAQACSTEAITFGNINDPKSKVHKLKRDKRNYDLLAEVNTRPRTSYLSKITNKNPALEKPTNKEAHG